MKSVFFGPWVGEFGWELVWWHGWVKKLCRTVYRDHHRVAASYPGRRPFYPDVHEFWAHPDGFPGRPISQNSYITDYWRAGFPRGNVTIRKKRFLVRDYFERVPVTADAQPDVEPTVLELLRAYETRLPAGCEIVAPFRLNVCPLSGRPVGMDIAPRPAADGAFRSRAPRFEDQTFEPLSPSPEAVEYIERIAGGADSFVAVFPRARSLRRPDKNWPKEKYDELIARCRERFPGHTVAVVGEPGGAYYADGVPPGCLDLINVDRALRMDVQVALLRRAAVAIGGMSGAMLFALACRCPSVIVGLAVQRSEYFRQNVLQTPLVYYPFIDADPARVVALADGVLRGTIPPPDQASWDPNAYFGLAATIWGRVRLLRAQ